MNIAGSYSNYFQHAHIAHIIRTHSENRHDIREMLKAGVDWRKAKRLLDLGCGYGWFEETLDVYPELIVGVDCLSENEQPFLATTAGKAEKVLFQNQKLPSEISFPDSHFDVVICAYSLYFFPGALPEISRVLGKDGTFIVITHSERMLEEGKAFFNFENLHEIIKSFSAENGEQLLKQYFAEVRALDYSNALFFNKTDEEDLASYIDFKKEFISRDCDPEEVKNTMIRELRRDGYLRLNKNDRIFFATK